MVFGLITVASMFFRLTSHGALIAQAVRMQCPPAAGAASRRWTIGFHKTFFSVLNAIRCPSSFHCKRGALQTHGPLIFWPEQLGEGFAQMEAAFSC